MVVEINIIDERATNSQRYRILGKKGEGTFSEVLKCQHIKDGNFFAMKRMKQRYTSIDQINNLREIQAMRRLSPHDNIVELKEVLFNKKTGILSLICELMDQNLYELIRERRSYMNDTTGLQTQYSNRIRKHNEDLHVRGITGRKSYLPESDIRSYMFQLCKSIEHLHKNGIFHRDVKPENVLLRAEKVKLGDFGSCRSVFSKQPYTEYISTRWYRAPECVLTDGYYNHKMDIWSIGCVMYEIMTLHPLFPGANEVDQVAKIHDVLGTPSQSTLDKLRKYKSRSLDFNFPYKRGTGLAKMIPFGSKDCRELLLQLLVYDPDDRISARQAVRHPFFKEMRDLEKKLSAAAPAAEPAKPTKATEEAERRKRKLNNHRTRPSYFTSHQDKVSEFAPLPASNLNKAMKVSSHHYYNSYYNAGHTTLLPPIDSNAQSKKNPVISSTKPSRTRNKLGNGLSLSAYKNFSQKDQSNKSIYDMSHYLPNINKRLGGGG
ncbi:MAPK/MAK/MRK overlapping kinase-like isoform X2 [Bolinopsis microptera]|uniref:MAPK/MAK/MRK overlapping kinase-like isoform X2 n=1 Tax=Bolinopsis microptera TaxID=2820187 RepID=UPI00307AF57C